MWSTWLALPLLGSLSGICSESVIDFKQREEGYRPFASLLLAVTPKGPRIGRQRLSAPSGVRLEPRTEMTDEAVEEKDEATDSEAKPEFKGIAKSFSKGTKYGFISSPEITDKYGRDAIVMATDFGGIMVGDAVAFDVEEQENNGVKAPKAINLQKIKPDRPVFTGVVKSFFSEKKYGFISCPPIKKKYGKDAIVLATDFGGFKLGDEVRFNVEVQEKDGAKSARAINLRRIGTNPIWTKASELADSNAVEQMDGSAAMAEAEKLTKEFSELTAEYKEDLLKKWKSSDAIFKSQVDASDLDAEQRALLVGNEGSNFLRATDLSGNDFIWMDSEGKISVYGPAEEKVRNGLLTVSRLVLYEQQKEKTKA